jgi:hypothetical protein
VYYSSLGCRWTYRNLICKQNMLSLPLDVGIYPTAACAALDVCSLAAQPVMLLTCLFTAVCAVLGRVSPGGVGPQQLLNRNGCKTDTSKDTEAAVGQTRPKTAQTAVGQTHPKSNSDFCSRDTSEGSTGCYRIDIFKGSTGCCRTFSLDAAHAVGGQTRPQALRLL